MKNVQDHYFRKAKKDGYVARSAYKLQEIDQKNGLINKGDRVLDLGCFPGSWMQYIAKQVGSSGLVVGIDRTPLEISLGDNMRFIHSDINDLDLDILGQHSERFDLVCSDMAPNTSGIKSTDAARSFQLCRMALLVAEKWLKPGGATLVKILQGSSFPELQKLMREEYATVKNIKPKSSRSESKEIFVLGLNRK